eukprot:7384150-Prymnesium_polylepis.1
MQHPGQPEARAPTAVPRRSAELHTQRSTQWMRVQEKAAARVAAEAPGSRRAPPPARLRSRAAPAAPRARRRVAPAARPPRSSHAAAPSAPH